MTDHLDDLLRSSAPPVTPASEGLERELERLVTASAAVAATAPPRGRRRRPVVAGVGLAALLGGGVGVAAAAPGIAEWVREWRGGPDARIAFPVTGGTCEAYMKVMPGPGSSRGFDEPAVLAGKAYLESLDVNALDTSSARRDLEDMTVTDVNGDPLPPLTDAELDESALTRTVSRMVYDEVQRQRFETEIAIEGSIKCSDDPQ